MKHTKESPSWRQTPSEIVPNQRFPALSWYISTMYSLICRAESDAGTVGSSTRCPPGREAPLPAAGVCARSERGSSAQAPPSASSESRASIEAGYDLIGGRLSGGAKVGKAEGPRIVRSNQEMLHAFAQERTI
ncbi:hypothetical protein OV079_23575 [Nannocystis pusilla]|uniref:Uncharacterized protein n=1 Tax=Nannocystis pusilla TaxID=889268 RepID=A0A9X3EQW3_9BACT|nr:hypothetical protein [Nannocystis pusilla]MCY1008483.1 hypothetical protein [Nannocystis pusilla]